MDPSIIHNQNIMGVQNKLPMYKTIEAVEETDVKGNNNLSEPSKTEISTNATYPGSLLQDTMHKHEDSGKGETSLDEYSTLEKAMNLKNYSRKDEKKKTIFEDAEYFAKNYMYKLLPITFETVDETIIHTEHNYCNSFLSSESEAEGDCSRTMDYSLIKEKNYKKRKAKNYTPAGNNKYVEQSESVECSEKHNVETAKCNNVELSEEPFNSPIDLSAPLVQEDKTDNCLIENQLSIVRNKINNSISNNMNGEEKEDGVEFDSDKENLKSNVRYIEVTITRPNEKENYQPCDLFLNDIAKLVPRLIEKDCFEIDIVDKTSYLYLDIVKHRLYYVISEPSWRLFQNTNERIILTNDQNLGLPIQTARTVERPTFLVFDQHSLTKCLADYCEEIGGCFEYTCVEDLKTDNVELKGKEEEKAIEYEEEVVEPKTEVINFENELVKSNDKDEVIESVKEVEESERVTEVLKSDVMEINEDVTRVEVLEDEKKVPEICTIENGVAENDMKTLNSENSVEVEEKQETVEDLKINEESEKSTKKEDKPTSETATITPSINTVKSKKLKKRISSKKPKGKNKKSECLKKPNNKVIIKPSKNSKEIKEDISEKKENSEVKIDKIICKTQMNVTVNLKKIDLDSFLNKNEIKVVKETVCKKKNDRRVGEKSKGSKNIKKPEAKKKKVVSTKSNESLAGKVDLKPKKKASIAKKEDNKKGGNKKMSTVKIRSKLNVTKREKNVKCTASQNSDKANNISSKGTKRKSVDVVSTTPDNFKKRKQTEFTDLESNVIFESKTRSGKFVEKEKPTLESSEKEKEKEKKKNPVTVKPKGGKNSKEDAKQKIIKRKVKKEKVREMLSLRLRSQAKNTRRKVNVNVLKGKVKV